jgi:hypothetical protein
MALNRPQHFLGLMSQLGQSRRFGDGRVESGSPPIPDIRRRDASIIAILPITRQRLRRLKQLSARITHRNRSPQFLQLGFEKVVCDDQSLDGLTNIAADTALDDPRSY